MNARYLLLCTISSLFFASSIARERYDFEDIPHPNIAFKGYIVSGLWWDTRQVIAVREDDVLFYPAKKLFGIDGQDINDKAKFNTVPIQTRLRAELTGVNALDANITGIIEGDFHGRDEFTTGLFWMRHLYTYLEWARTKLQIGYTWHPMFVVECYPDTVMFGAGLPYEAFARNAQVRVRHSFDYFDIFYQIGSQLEFVNDGVIGFNSIYARNSAIPENHLQIQIPWREHLFGAGVDFKVIRPRLSTALVNRCDEPLYAEDATLACFTGLAFARFELKHAILKMKVIVGQNISELDMIGGYAVKCVDWITDRRTYTNIGTLSTWVDIEGRPIESRHIPNGVVSWGLFAGFTQNLGAADKLADLGSFPPELTDIQSFRDIIFSRGPDIDNSFRVAPRVMIDIYPMRFAFELELDRTAYGTPNQWARVCNTCPVWNVRLLFKSYYFFA